MNKEVIKVLKLFLNSLEQTHRDWTSTHAKRQKDLDKDLDGYIRDIGGVEEALHKIAAYVTRPKAEEDDEGYLTINFINGTKTPDNRQG